MQKQLLFFFVTLFNLSNLSAQKIVSYNFANENANVSSKPTVVYFCATWCVPCMDKFVPVVDSLKNDSSYNFIIVVESTNFQKIIPIIDEHHYDRSMFRYLDLKYYGNSKGLIQMNPQEKAFKKLAKEFDERFAVTNTRKKLWVGSIAIYSENHLFLSGPEYTATELIDVTRQALSQFQIPVPEAHRTE